MEVAKDSVEQQNWKIQGSFNWFTIIDSKSLFKTQFWSDLKCRLVVFYVLNLISFAVMILQIFKKRCKCPFMVIYVVRALEAPNSTTTVVTCDYYKEHWHLHFSSYANVFRRFEMIRLCYLGL